MKYDFSFILLHISFILLISMFVYLVKMKDKKQIHYTFFSMISSILIWTFGYLGLFYIYNIYGINSLLFIKIIFTGIILTPLSVFFFGYVFAYTRIKFNWKFKLLFVIPFVSLCIIYTNEYHHLFYKYFTATDTINRIWAPWFTIHAVYSYTLIFIGLWYLLYFSIKNSGFFSKQSNLIIIGVLFSLVINMLITLNIGNLPYYFESIAFSITSICFAFAIIKFKFLNIVPVALQHIVDLISDSYLVIDEDMDIIDYNKTFTDTFKGVLEVERKDNLVDVLEKNSSVDIDRDRIFELNKKAIEKKKSFSFEKHIEYGDFDKYFTIEITPIFSNDQYLGTIILLKDITEHKKDMELVKSTQRQLVERERVASLGQLVGGIAHNLKNSIMSVSGVSENLYNLIKEYEESIDDASVTKEDHHEIAQDMYAYIDKFKPYLSYMSDVIATIKEQTVQTNASMAGSFGVDELVNRVEILMGSLSIVGVGIY